MTTIPERIQEEAQGLVANFGSDPEGLLVGAISAALLAAEKRGREEAAKIISSSSARFAIQSQNPSKSEEVAEILRITERLLGDLAQLIRSTN